MHHSFNAGMHADVAKELACMICGEELACTMCGERASMYDVG